MSRDAYGTTVEELLAHTGWIRALARSLVVDPQAADDIAQDTMLTALERPPREGGGDSIRAWLARVARNFARQRSRGESRRAKREAIAGGQVGDRKGLETPSAAELASRLDMQRVLTEIVADLGEANRTVLLLHYFEGLSLVEIARRTQSPAGTIRWRLKRALEQVREAMDARHGGDRDAWRAALLPIAGLPVSALSGGAGGAGVGGGASASAATGAAVGAGATGLGWIAAGTAVVVLAATAYFLWKTLQLDAKRPDAPVVAQADLPVEAAKDDAEGRAERTVAANAESVASDDTTSGDTGRGFGGMLDSFASLLGGAGLPPDQSATIHVRAIDERGDPVADVEVALVGYESLVLTGIAESGVQGFTARTDDRGLGRLDLFVPGAVLATIAESMRPKPGEPVELILEVRSPNHASTRTTVVASDGAVVDAGDVVLLPGGSIEGRLVDELGDPIADAWVSVLADPEPLEDESWVWRGPRRYDGRKSVQIESDGRFTLSGVEVGTHRVWAKLPDGLYAQTDVEVSEGQNSTVEIVHIDDGTAPRALTVEVVDPDGVPVERAHVRIDLRNIAGDVQGARFGTVSEGGLFRSGVVPEDPMMTLDVYAHDESGRLGSSVVRDVSARQGTLRVVLDEAEPLSILVVDSDEGVLDRFSVALSDATSQGWSLGRWDLTAEAPTIAMPPVPFELTVEADGHLPRRLGPFEPASVGSTLRVRLEALASSYVTVVADGRPVAGAAVEVLQEIAKGAVLVNGHVSSLRRFGTTTVTDGDGVFRFEVDEPARYSIRIDADGYAPTDVRLRIEPHRAVEGLVVELDRGGSIEGRVLVAEGRDPQAHWVTAHRGDGFARSVRPDAEGRYRFDCLTPGDWRVEITDRSKSDDQMTIMPAARTTVDWNCHVDRGHTTRHDIDLRYVEQCELVGQLRVDGRRPRGDWRARLLDTDSRAESSAQTGSSSASVGADGSYRVALDDPRDVLLELDGPDFCVRIPVSIPVGLTRSDVSIATSRVSGMFDDPALAAERIWFLEIDVEEAVHGVASVLRSADGSFTAIAPSGTARLIGRKQGEDDLEIPDLFIPSNETVDFGSVPSGFNR